MIQRYCVFLLFFLASCPINLFLVWNHQAEIIIVKRLKRLLPNIRIYGEAYKNTHTRIKFLPGLVCFVLPFTEHAYFSMRIFTLGKEYSKIRTRYASEMETGGSTAAVADPENFGGGGILSTKPQKFGCLHQNWEWFFGRNRKFKRHFRPKSGVLQKKKRSSPKLRLIFRPDSLRLGWWGGCIPKWSRIIRNRGWFFGQNRYF